jgi:hypothetical protein
MDNFVSLLMSGDRTVNKKMLLQNMKCLFAKTAARQVQLYRHIDDALSVVPSRDRYVRVELIDLFIPEIRFLILMRTIFALKTRNPSFGIPDSYRNRWEMYLRDNNLGRDTTPEDYLNYLCVDVLSNLISHKQYLELLAKSSEMSLLLLEGMSSPNSFYDTMGIINRIVSKIMNRDKKEGGRLKSKKNCVQNKKSKNQNKKSRNKNQKTKRI